MGMPGSQFTDALIDKIDELPLGTGTDLARALPLYIKAHNDNGVVRNISLAYIDNYDGKSVYKRFKRQFDQMFTVFQRNLMAVQDVQLVFKKVASREVRFPTTVKGMECLKGVVFDEVQKWRQSKKLNAQRQKLVAMFQVALKHYLKLTWELGFNEPSQCVRSLAESHKLDKYIMAGDFALMLLPFLPELEEVIRRSYERYEMKDAWEMLKGRYFDHKSEYANLAAEIKSTFKKRITNFSDYFDELYTNKFRKMMLNRRQQGND